jgi:sugar fermentation stimulation protein A
VKIPQLNFNVQVCTVSICVAGEVKTLVSFVRIEGKTVRGIFRERPNRFLALVDIQNRTLPSFLPNPGRMHELLTRGTEVILKEVVKGDRKTSYDLIGVIYDSQMVSVDSRVPNKLVLQALRKRDMEEFSEYDIIKPEYSYGHTRFDFFLANEHERCLLETKSCTLVKEGMALFPDAETERGRRHIRNLGKARKEGYRACVLFIVQRTDANAFAPNAETDPEFAKVLRDAALKGVEVYAYNMEISASFSSLSLSSKLNVYL